MQDYYYSIEAHLLIATEIVAIEVYLFNILS